MIKERKDTRQLSGIVQINDPYYGGERHGGKRGLGSENKAPFIAAVSTSDESHPISMNFHVVERCKLTEVITKEQLIWVISAAHSTFNSIVDAVDYALSDSNHFEMSE